MYPTALHLWRPLHRWSSGLVGVVALVHCAMTPVLYDGWHPDALWFLGTGMALLLLSAMNLAHVRPASSARGPLPTAPVLRWANVGFLVFGLAALLAIAEPQALMIVLGLLAQAVASFWTLPGPPRPPSHDATGS